jgi:hypothetical protein
MSWKPGAGHVVTFQAPSAGWTLEYLELATHHGNTSGANYIVVLPASGDRYVRPGTGWIVVGWFALFLALVFDPPQSLPGWMNVVGRIAAGIVVALLLVVQCSNWVSGYRVLLSSETYVRWIALALASRVWFSIRWLVAAERPAQLPRVVARELIPITRAGLVALAVLAVYGSVAKARLIDSYGGNYSGFLLVSQASFDRNPLLRSRSDIRSSLVLNQGGGYDGEFMYFATFDPFLLAFKDHPVMYGEVMDAAPYRFGRIGYSWLTWVFSAGRWERYPTTMIWMILFSLALVAFVLALMAQEHGLTPALGGLVIAIPGFWQSLQSGLPEPIAAATLSAGLLSLSRGRSLFAGALFALSLLIRETGVVFVACTIVAAVIAGRRREAAIVALLAGGTVLTWRIYVAWILFPDWGLQGLLFHAPIFGWPFLGIRDLWRSIALGQYFSGVPELSRAGIAYPLLLLGGFVLASVLAATLRNALGAAALIYAIMAICLNYAAVWLHVGNGQRVTYELFLMLALCCVTIRTYPQLLQKGLIAFWSCSIAYAFLLTFDASYIRSALALPF